MRTIRRTSRTINKEKWKKLKSLVQRYGFEKDDHLMFLGSGRIFGFYPSYRSRRDELVHDKYKSTYQLQGRQWKMALKDAYETIDKWWLSIGITLKGLVAQRKWNNIQKRYGYWLIQSSQRLSLLASGRTLIPLHFDIARSEYGIVRNTLARQIRKQSFKSPRVKRLRSFSLDADMYEVFEHNGRQYIRIMSLTPGKRIIIPLTGKTPIKGNIRVVLDDEKQRIEVHYTAKVKKSKELTGDTCGLDAGITEVFTDEQNNRYGQDFGEQLAQASERTKNKGQKRNKLYQLKKRAETDEQKKHLQKYNLGKKKQHHYWKRTQLTLEKTINQAINEILIKRQPRKLVVESLDFRGKSKSKSLSRLVNLWMRRVLKERTEFKASAGGSCREAVNPAYSSQTCLQCGYVDAKNRSGEKFQCLHCGYEDFADRVGAANLKARLGDKEITLWTPKAQVKSILLGRFIALLESS